MQKHIFLGGTCGNNPWRETIVIPRLLAKGVPQEALFNPVVSHWDAQAQAREDQAKQDEQFLLLFVIASPDPATTPKEVSGYSLVEVVMSLYDWPQRTVAVFDTAHMAQKTAKRMQKAAQDLQQRFPTAPIFLSYDTAIDWLVAHFS